MRSPVEMVNYVCMVQPTRQVKNAYINGYSNALRAVLDIINNEYPGLFGGMTDEMQSRIADLMKTALQTKKK